MPVMDNRSNILQVALDLFTVRGYDAVGVQEIAEAAGVTKPTLYHYYDSKEGLLRALVERYSSPLLQAVEAASQYRGDLPLTLEKLARAYFDFASTYPIYYRLQVSLLFAPKDSEANKVVSTINQQQYGLVEHMFQAAANDHGNMRGRQRQYAETWIGMINTYIILWLNGNVRLDNATIHSLLQQYQYGIYS
jgi:AcrR family transcriptional regulator